MSYAMNTVQDSDCLEVAAANSSMANLRVVLQMHRTAHNIHEAGRQTWSTAWQGVTRPSSLLSLFSRQKADEEWGGSRDDHGSADHRRQLLRYSNDHESGSQHSPSATNGQ